MRRGNSPHPSVKDFLRAEGASSPRQDRDCQFGVPSLADSSRSYLTRHCQRVHHCSRLVNRFFIFSSRIRIGDDACAGLEVRPPVFQHCASQRDTGIKISVEPKVANGACVTAAARFFQFADDLHRPDFGCAGDSSRRKRRSNCIIDATTVVQTAYYVRHDMHDMAVALDLHELCYSNGAEFRDAADVIAGEIHKHNVFSPLLRIREELSAVGVVLSWSEATSACPCDWTNLYSVTG